MNINSTTDNLINGINVPIVDTAGRQVKQESLSRELFDCPLRVDILHQIVLWQLAKRRSGTHSSKGCGQVAGSGRKPHRQKGTGRARLGSRRSPQCRGGGVVFGPQPRDHSRKLNKKVRTLGLRIALSDRVRNNKLMLIESPNEILKTKEMNTMCSVIAKGERVLVISERAINAARNLPNANSLACAGLNVYDILLHDCVLIDAACLSAVMQRLA